MLSAICGLAQTKEDILAGKYNEELKAWPEGLKYSSEWRECQSSIATVKEKLADAKEKAQKELIEKEFAFYEELHALVLNEVSEDVYEKVREGNSDVALKINEVVKLEDLYSWDRSYAPCKERIARAERWAEGKSEAAKQFPEEFKAGTLNDKLYSEKTRDTFGEPTLPEDYSPYDSLLYSVGDREEKMTLFVKSEMRKKFYEKVKPLYKNGLYEEKVITTKSSISRVIIYSSNDFKVFEELEYHFGGVFRFIDGYAVAEKDFELELSKYKK